MYVPSFHRGLGDTSDSGSMFDVADPSFLGGSVLTSFVLGIGIIIAMKTVLKPKRSSSSGKIWANGAWRSPDYEYWTEEDRRRGPRRRARTK